MKYYFILFVLVSIRLFSEPITEKMAFEIANNILKNKSQNQEIFQTKNLLFKQKSYDGNNAYYVIGDNSQYVIISGHDQVVPILGYSHNSYFDPQNIPNNLAKWLESYKKQINHIVSNNFEPIKGTKKKWEELTSNKNTFNITNTVGPLVQAKWDQGNYYNDLCPWDSRYNERAVTGCVATAMAQIMYHNKFPKQGQGLRSYVHDQYGRLSANFGATTYNWASMPTYLNSSNSSVATLMYHCGVSVDMQYGVDASGAYVIHNSNFDTSAEYALKNYFGYKNVSGIRKEDYTETEWIDILKNQIDQDQPILYRGSGNGGGHAWVCDGYDNNDYFHMNWGWGGAYDGFFYINDLKPQGLGTGGGSGNYNTNQAAIINIKPANQGQASSEIVIQNDVIMESDTISLFSDFTINAQIANVGNKSFSGEYCAAVFDSEENFVEIFDIKNESELKSGYAYNNGLNFQNEGSLKLIPGKYYIDLFYRETGGDWKIINGIDGNTTSWAELVVVNYQYISLYSTLSVENDDEIYSNGQLSASVDIANYYDEDFEGSIGLFMYNTDGEFVQDIQIFYNNSLKPNHYDSYQFSNNSIDVDPGSYILAVMYLWPGQENWGVAGSWDELTNPIYIVVKEPLVTADHLENNNSVSQAAILDLNYVNNNASTKIENVTIHNVDDLDYYHIILEDGFKYNFNPRLHDSFDNEDNGDYDLDALWSYSTDGTHWSETYDDILYDPIEISNTENLYIKVAPFFQGETGNYSLEINSTRTELGSPQISIAADLDFGEIEIGEESEKTFFIYNLGDQNLEIQSIEVPVDFYLDWDAGTIQANSSKEISLTFIPREEKKYDGTIIINSNDITSPTSIPITAKAFTNPQISIIADLNFGDVEIGQDSNIKFTIFNNGGKTLEIESIIIPNDFHLDWDGGEIDVDGFKDINLTFSPTEEKNYNSKMIVISNDENSPTSIPIIASSFSPMSVMNTTRNEFIDVSMNKIRFLKSHLKYQMLDLSGKIREQGLSEDKNEIYLENLNNGIYFLKIFNDNKVESINKIVIQK